LIGSVNRYRPKIRLGTVGHFGVAVRDPKKSAWWWKSIFDLREEPFSNGDVVGVSNENVTIVLMRGVPRPKTIDHMSFHLPSMRALREALAILKKRKVAIEDPGNEIGPEGPGSKNMGLWFYDPDGYRWELSVLAKSRR
jgi:catechol 2,3-dioxygenase-like lactoylglutathione lyase family enzyme